MPRSPAVKGKLDTLAVNLEGYRLAAWLPIDTQKNARVATPPLARAKPDGNGLPSKARKVARLAKGARHTRGRDLERKA